MITVTEVRTKKQWKDFAVFPIRLYKDCPYYVPAFIADDKNISNPKKNPPAKNCDIKAFLAYKDGVLAGRIACIVAHESNELFNQKRIRFTRFDAIDDISVTTALIQAVEAYAKTQGLTEIHGPWGFNDTDREGMLTDGYDEMGSYATNYNFPYYNEHMEKLGFVKESGWVESEIHFPTEGEPLFERYYKLGEYTKRRYRLRELCETLSVKEIIKLYGDKFFDCYNAAYKDLDMFVEIKDEAKQAVLDQFAVMVNKEFLSVLVNEEDEIAAFFVVLPSFGKIVKKHGGKMTLPFIFDLLRYMKKPDTVELTLIAVQPEYRKKGYSAGCIARLLKSFSTNGVKRVISCPTLESNTAVRAQWNAMDSKIIKTRQTYIKNID
ncbi:MAG: GNAT family N-acetyltransferase [Clostridia bacterium]|nr:GNAT family N-acetyltransferase [Clostridia bacterium]